MGIGIRRPRFVNYAGKSCTADLWRVSGAVRRTPGEVSCVQRPGGGGEGRGRGRRLATEPNKKHGRARRGAGGRGRGRGSRFLTCTQLLVLHFNTTHFFFILNLDIRFVYRNGSSLFAFIFCFDSPVMCKERFSPQYFNMNEIRKGKK